MQNLQFVITNMAIKVKTRSNKAQQKKIFGFQDFELKLMIM
mgnify:FL=1